MTCFTTQEANSGRCCCQSKEDLFILSHDYNFLLCVSSFRTYPTWKRIRLPKIRYTSANEASISYQNSMRPSLFYFYLIKGHQKHQNTKTPKHVFKREQIGPTAAGDSLRRIVSLFDWHQIRIWSLGSIFHRSRPFDNGGYHIGSRCV